MKVIDLLNKIANKKDLPSVIILPEVFKIEYRTAYLIDGYYCLKDGKNLSFMCGYLELNDPIEIKNNLSYEDIIILKDLYESNGYQENKYD